MKITAKINKLFNEGNVKAAATVIIEDVFVIRNVRLVEGANRIFISMPSRRTMYGEYKSVCYPISEDFRLQILGEVMDAYESVIAGHAAVCGYEYSGTI